LPLGVALNRHDEAVSLLAALGATVDVSINPPHSRMTLLQWLSAMLKKLRTPSVSRTTQEEPPIGDTWAQYNAYLAAVLPTKEKEGSVKPQKTRSIVIRHLDEEQVLAITDYYARMESILRAYSTMSEAPQSGETPTAPTSRHQHCFPQGTGYVRHTKHATVPIQAHLEMFYDELYEACWTGDNAMIQELCLPKYLKENKEPIQISVVTTRRAGPVYSTYAPLTGTSMSNFQLKLGSLTLSSQGGLLSSSRCIVVTGIPHAL
jgi:hypothetical protein